MKAALRDARLVAEALGVIVVTWLALGQYFGHAITQADGSVFVVPYTHSALAGGFDWTHHLYRFGVLGGSAMHDFAGTLPIVQLCALLGVSTTTTVNVITMFVQLCLAFFGVKLIDALVATWRDGGLTGMQRVIAIWACAFAPLVGWRLAMGHDNLLYGLLPFVAAVAGWCCARVGRLSATCLVMIAVAVWHGVSTLGAQTIIYSVVFGAPLAVAIAWAPRGQRWSREHMLVLGALAAGVLVALPRVAGMIAYATGDDTARTLDQQLTYSFGTAGWRDWLGSVPWTARASAAWFGDSGLHEHNFPLGPLALLLVAAWPRAAPKRWLVGIGAGLVLAILFAGDVTPIADALLAIVKPLRAFRVPARAVMPLFVLVPPLALAAAWSRAPTDADEPAAVSRVRWLAIAVGLVLIALVRGAAPWPREVAAWLGCAAIIVMVRPGALAGRALVARAIARRALVVDIALALLAALGVAAFAERFPTGLPNGPIEDAPARLHDAVLAQAPELANPLVRVEIVDPPMPYVMSTAFAAGLGSLDGDYNPPRRYLELISAASGHRLPPTAVVFQLARDRSFTLLQQMYDVRYVLARDTLEALPEPPGPAWFPEHVASAPDAETVVRALRGEPDLRTALLRTAWVENNDDASAVRPACTGATVHGATTDALGQTATIDVTTTSDCALVVSANYVSFLRANATVHGETREAAMFPIDVALIGVMVPAGADRVVIEPVATIPTWTRIASLLGIALLAACIAVSLGRLTSPS